MTTEVPTAQATPQASIPAERRWQGPQAPRSKADRMRPAPPPLAQENLCPVAALACEAAAAVRLKEALELRAQDPDLELIDALEVPEDHVRPEEMARALFERLKAIVSIASHRRPTSTKGALFLLYAAASAARNPQGLIAGRLSGSDDFDLACNDRLVQRLHQAAMAPLEADHFDDDLRALRAWYFPKLDDVHAVCERALGDCDGLIGEARRRAAEGASHRKVQA